jgi:hypothetical protein
MDGTCCLFISPGKVQNNYAKQLASKKPVFEAGGQKGYAWTYLGAARLSITSGEQFGQLHCLSGLTVS